MEKLIFCAALSLSRYVAMTFYSKSTNWDQRVRPT